MRPFFWRARVRLHEMGDCQARAQHRTAAAIEEKYLLGDAVAQGAPDTTPDILTDPCSAQPDAFQAQECDLVEWIARPQARIEFEAIDDSHGVAEPDVLWPQVAVTVDDAAGTRGKRLVTTREKPLLDTSHPPDKP